ncbi:hypothetical protein N7462_002516 [Penicillium macrosclerotiorum]|uniref:uncharacterized protein n=1 Tax=Penicillium macrosclerotiorum TaxID=303699 RepID=UPI002546CE10|nr:uncharacterized protein N7462_002516 [Penicillium macrosclerotiorum]KAJ5693093.1 hypothetical protein N7462_002516 [Penicillium macrosclerotiorum]
MKFFIPIIAFVAANLYGLWGSVPHTTIGPVRRTSIDRVFHFSIPASIVDVAMDHILHHVSPPSAIQTTSSAFCASWNTTLHSEPDLFTIISDDRGIWKTKPIMPAAASSKPRTPNHLATSDSLLRPVADTDFLMPTLLAIILVMVVYLVIKQSDEMHRLQIIQQDCSQMIYGTLELFDKLKRLDQNYTNLHFLGNGLLNQWRTMWANGNLHTIDLNTPASYMIDGQIAQTLKKVETSLGCLSEGIYKNNAMWEEAAKPFKDFPQELALIMAWYLTSGFVEPNDDFGVKLSPT